MRLRNLQSGNETIQRNYTQTILVIEESRDGNDYTPILQSDEYDDGPSYTHYLYFHILLETNRGLEMLYYLYFPPDLFQKQWINYSCNNKQKSRQIE